LIKITSAYFSCKSSLTKPTNKRQVCFENGRNSSCSWYNSFFMERVGYIAPETPPGGLGSWGFGSENKQTVNLIIIRPKTRAEIGVFFIFLGTPQVRGIWVGIILKKMDHDIGGDQKGFQRTCFIMMNLAVLPEQINSSPRNGMFGC
jgi:hypothetical protein